MNQPTKSTEESEDQAEEAEKKETSKLAELLEKYGYPREKTNPPKELIEYANAWGFDLRHPRPSRGHSGVAKPMQFRSHYTVWTPKTDLVKDVDKDKVDYPSRLTLEIPEHPRHGWPRFLAYRMRGSTLAEYYQRALASLDVADSEAGENIKPEVIPELHARVQALEDQFRLDCVRLKETSEDLDGLLSALYREVLKVLEELETPGKDPQIPVLDKARTAHENNFGNTEGVLHAVASDLRGEWYQFVRITLGRGRTRETVLEEAERLLTDWLALPDGILQAQMLGVIHFTVKREPILERLTENSYQLLSYGSILENAILDKPVAGLKEMMLEHQNELLSNLFVGKQTRYDHCQAVLDGWRTDAPRIKSMKDLQAYSENGEAAVKAAQRTLNDAARSWGHGDPESFCEALQQLLEDVNEAT